VGVGILLPGELIYPRQRHRRHPGRGTFATARTNVRSQRIGLRGDDGAMMARLGECTCLGMGEHASIHPSCSPSGRADGVGGLHPRLVQFSFRLVGQSRRGQLETAALHRAVGLRLGRPELDRPRSGSAREHDAWCRAQQGQHLDDVCPDGSTLAPGQDGRDNRHRRAASPRPVHDRRTVKPCSRGVEVQ